MMQSKRRGSPIRPSTRAFAREARRTSGYSLFDWLHGYVYARWPYLYIGIATGEHPLSRIIRPTVRLAGRLFPPRSDNGGDPVTFADTYHGKVVPLDAATQLVTVEEDVTLTDLEHLIPYALARDIVLQNPDHIVVLECPCRAARPNPCQPLDVCLIVGEPFANFVIEHHPRRARWITQGEAVEILRAEQERGHVHHAFFKDAMLGRFYAICNCCSCCCGAMQAHQHGTPMLASSGYVAAVKADLCAACGSCTGSCQFAAISVDDGFARIDAAACMGCGVCVAQCPQEAVSLLRDPTKGEPLKIQVLIAEAESTAQN
jgi:Pyruvate/2-oxoacid:ferredoxin oxidoreductase delta subunit